VSYKEKAVNNKIRLEGGDISQPVKKFLPFLLFYLLLSLLFHSPVLTGDEPDYINYATRISKGLPTETLWWGPGYPIVLATFILFSLPLYSVKIMNAFFLFVALIFFYKILTFYFNEQYATIGAFLFGIYPLFMRQLHLVYSENLAVLLVCGFIYFFVKLIRNYGTTPRHSWVDIFFASLFLGYLALTKIFFGYVILVTLILASIVFLCNRNENKNRAALIISGLALLINIPYLFFTYRETGKLFYWGSSGGMSLYWMSSPYENDLGDWFSFEAVQELPELAPHRPFFESLDKFSEAEMDTAFKKKALQNIFQYPQKYMMNWIANVGRLFFSYPFSYTPQKISTYFYLFPNMFIVALLALSGVYVLRYQVSVPYEIKAQVIFGLISLGATSLVSAYARQFAPLAPIFLFWILWFFSIVDMPKKETNDVND
jgi:hypothetical protein